jgi:hypothetical protein
MSTLRRQRWVVRHLGRLQAPVAGKELAANCGMTSAVTGDAVNL